MGGLRRLAAVSDEEVRRMYCDDLLTMAEIGGRVGCTKQAVYFRLDRMGVEYRGGRVFRPCDHCGEVYSVRRNRVKQGRAKFCGIRCYHEHTSVYGKYSRQGQRGGRKVAEAVVGEVVHHIDGDTTNNDPGNLIVFPSNAAHMSFHKSGGAVWLKERVESGVIVVKEVTRWPSGDDSD